MHFQPFDPVHKRTEASVKGKDGKTFKVSKGAPQVILQLAANAGQVKSGRRESRQRIRGARLSFAGRRAGRGRGANGSSSASCRCSIRPARMPKSTIATALTMGVKVKMVTGDALAIAKETATKLGHGDQHPRCRRAWAMPRSRRAQQVADSIEKADGFAQVFPEHKFHIVDVLQKRGHIVGMTGDGVNDAPALKKADCGIAVSGATDAARAAASIVLMTPGLSVIIDAIKESRKIFQRMNSYAIYRIAETLRVLLFMTTGDPGLQFLSVDGRHDRDAGAAQRRRHPLHCLRQRSLQGCSPKRGICAWCSGSPRCWASSAPIAAFGLFFLG